ncbi:toll/interleukin-1 receptor domain-containing protein [Kordiimonas pumila]|uniref:TIR domain-containing protein n=1 Tax=Kordiimonas pumila TaxID=2161677 RepID=A0ABV7D093_9PROT|nr:toll/interleukin-1 receptor domain-containing protein [Kordiimonas pumila]
MSENFTYSAFLSYSHRDKKAGAWLHRQLEHYRIPAGLVGKSTSVGVIPSHIGRIFRDRDELPATESLTAEVQKALASSRYMIVLCSPAAAASRWVNKEVMEFKRLRGEQYVLPVILSGEPFATRAGKPELECFPPSVRYKLAANGRLSAVESEPSAADLRKAADGKRRAVLKLIAGMVGVGLDQLVERDLRRKNRRVMFVTASSMIAMVAMSALTYEAVSARHAADRHRGEAENLIEFMLTDLRQKLEPVGRLDVLDAVGDKVIDYYTAQQTFNETTDDSMGRKARAYHLLGEMQFLRDHPEQASDLFQQSAAATAELLRRDPDNTQRIFEHAQSVFWVGNQDIQRGDLRAGEIAWQEYKRLADLLVTLEPETVDWWIEAAYGNLNIGNLYLRQHQNPRQALPYLEAALKTFQAALAVRPDSGLLKAEVSNSHSWIDLALRQTGHVQDVLYHMGIVYDMTQKALEKDPKNQSAKERLMVWHMKRAWVYQDTHNLAASIEQSRQSLALAEEWLRLEPEAAVAIRSKAYALYHLAGLAVESDDITSASELIAQASQFTETIFKDPTALEPWWQIMYAYSLVIDAKLSVRNVGVAFGANRFQHVATELQAYRDTLAGRQEGRMVLADFYKFYIQQLLLTGDAGGALKAKGELWRMVESENLDQIPVLLTTLYDIAKLVGDDVTASQIEAVLLERGYGVQAFEAGTAAKTISD